MPLKNFLNQVLPNEGYKCWIEISKGKKPIQGLVTTIDELAAKLLEIDSHGVDAYFACATYKSPQNRRAYNALGVQSQWMDLDVGPSKPGVIKYATIEEAVDACDAFARRLSLPLPGLVRSGGGIHAYWTFDRMLSHDEWVASAQRFKLLTIAYGLHADPTRTADISSVLRPPGTRNYKLPTPREVSYDDPECFERFPYAEFNDACALGYSRLGTSVVAVTHNNPYSVTPNNNLIAGIPASKVFDPTKGVPEGGGEHGGRDPACTAYAGILINKGYTDEQVLADCLIWNQLNQPPMSDAQVRKCVFSILRKHKASHPAPVLPPIEVNDNIETLPALPFGFRWGPAQQLIADVKDADTGLLVPQIVSNLPVFLKAMLNEEGSEQKNSYLFAQLHATKGWQRFAMNPKDFNGQQWYGEWVGHGGSLIAGSDKLLKTCVRRTENMLKLTGKELTRYSQFGWKDNDKAFLVGDTLCHADGRTERTQGTDKLTPLMHVMRPAIGGSLEDWTRAANKLFMPGMEAHAFMLLLSFAAPLMKFCVDEGNGGSIVSIVSEDSGKGKTPMATAIASVWGKLESTVVTGNFTENRRIEDLVRHCHLIQVQEEMAYSDPLIAAQGIEKFTSGSDRGRLTQSGAAGGIPERYQTIVVSISNKSLHDLVRTVNVPMSRRVFEIQIEAPADDDIASLGNIVREMMRNSGHAGQQFARYIVHPDTHNYIEEHLRGTVTVGSAQLKYRQLLNSQPEHRFIVWPLAAVDVAARIAVNIGLLSFDVERIMKWGVEQARAVMAGTAPGEHAQADMLDKFLGEHVDNCLAVTGPYKAANGPQVPLKLPRGRLCMRLEVQPGKLFITHDSIQKWCLKNNISFVNLGKKLTDSKIVLERSRMVSLAAGTEIAAGRSLCWEVDMNHPAISNHARLELKEELQDKAAKV